MLKIFYNGNKQSGEQPDTIEELLKLLNERTLNPEFEKYGNFVNNKPHWEMSESARTYEGCSTIFGNFLNIGHAFSIVTDDKEILAQLTKAIDNNKKSYEYELAKQQMEEGEDESISTNT